VNGDFADWFERVYTRHPKKGDKQIAAQYLSERASGGLDLTLVETQHIAWSQCPVWADSGGRFAPKLAQAVLDEFWRYDPPTETQERRRLSANERAMAGVRTDED
jgi:hypothetical protein